MKYLMNSVENQSSGDSSYITSTNTQGLRIFHPEPGTSLADAIGEQMPLINSNEIIQPISSILSNTESNNDSEKQSLNESENCKLKRNFKKSGII
jgi:hypothetical protein